MSRGREPRWRYAYGWHAIGMLLVALVVDLSLIPHPVEVPLEHGDKYGHLLAYATLMFWYAQIYDDPRTRTGIAGAFVAMGIALEFVQRMTGYRTFDIGDMVAGGSGVLVGWMLAPPRSPSIIRQFEARWLARRNGA